MQPAQPRTEAKAINAVRKHPSVLRARPVNCASSAFKWIVCFEKYRDIAGPRSHTSVPARENTACSPLMAAYNVSLYPGISILTNRACLIVYEGSLNLPGAAEDVSFDDSRQVLLAKAVDGYRVIDDFAATC